MDEYDVPLENAYFKGFNDEMTDYIRSLFEPALKTNEVWNLLSLPTVCESAVNQFLRAQKFEDYFCA